MKLRLRYVDDIGELLAACQQGVEICVSCYFTLGKYGSPLAWWAHFPLQHQRFGHHTILFVKKEFYDLAMPLLETRIWAPIDEDIITFQRMSFGDAIREAGLFCLEANDRLVPCVAGLMGVADIELTCVDLETGEQFTAANIGDWLELLRVHQDFRF